MKNPDEFYVKKTRFEALNDGVFAIAMTLMVIGIEVPEGITIGSSSAMLQALAKMWPLFFNYMLSFAILMSMWIKNNSILRHIETLSKPYTLISLASLMLICLMPFSSSLMGDYPNNPIAEIVFHANLLLLGILNLVRFLHMRKRTDLIVDEFKPIVNDGRMIRNVFIYIGVPLLAIAVSPFIPGYSTLSYLLMPLIAAMHKRQSRKT